MSKIIKNKKSLNSNNSNRTSLLKTIKNSQNKNQSKKDNNASSLIHSISIKSENSSNKTSRNSIIKHSESISSSLYQATSPNKKIDSKKLLKRNSISTINEILKKIPKEKNREQEKHMTKEEYANSIMPKFDKKKIIKRYSVNIESNFLSKNQILKEYGINKDYSNMYEKKKSKNINGVNLNEFDIDTNKLEKRQSMMITNKINYNNNKILNNIFSKDDSLDDSSKIEEKDEDLWKLKENNTLLRTKFYIRKKLDNKNNFIVNNNNDKLNLLNNNLKNVSLNNSSLNNSIINKKLKRNNSFNLEINFEDELTNEEKKKFFRKNTFDSYRIKKNIINRIVNKKFFELKKTNTEKTTLLASNRYTTLSTSSNLKIFHEKNFRDYDKIIISKYEMQKKYHKIKKIFNILNLSYPNIENTYYYDLKEKNNLLFKNKSYDILPKKYKLSLTKDYSNFPINNKLKYKKNNKTFDENNLKSINSNRYYRLAATKLLFNYQPNQKNSYYYQRNYFSPEIKKLSLQNYKHRKIKSNINLLKLNKPNIKTSNLLQNQKFYRCHPDSIQNIMKPNLLGYDINFFKSKKY
jgi:hypothetical protein